MFVVMVTLDVVAGGDEVFRELITANAAATVEGEEGCLRFDVSESIDHPGRFHLVEVYTSERAFREGHLSSEHFAEFADRSASLIVPGSKNETHSVSLDHDSEVAR